MSTVSKLTVGLLAAACIGMASAEEAAVVKFEKPADFIQPSLVKPSENALTLRGRAAFMSKTTFQVNPAVKYSISGEFRHKNGKPVRILFGFAPFAKDNTPIRANMVNGYNTTLTTLVEAAKKGDKVLKVKDASKWNTKTTYSFVAVNAAKDFSDLPNRNLLYTAVPNVKQNGTVWEITLKEPLKADIAAGTAVRQHLAGDGYIYTVRIFKPTEEWSVHSAMISGILRNGLATNRFWRGTVSAKLLILVLDGDSKSEFEIRNVKVTEVK